MRVLLTFTGSELDDFDNGVGQLNVLVNSQLLVDIPAGLNHLTGSGDYDSYNTAVFFIRDILLYTPSPIRLS